MNAPDFLGPEGEALVLAAVGRAEKATSAEVACVVATESGRYDRAESLVGLAFGLAGLGVADAAWGAGLPAGGWGEAAPLWVLAAAVVVGFLAGVLLSSRFTGLRRPLVPARELEDEVARGAAAAFTRLGVGTTRGRTGILVYVSLFERRVVVLLDEEVRAAAGPELADRLCAQATEGLRRGGRAEVLVGLVDAAAAALAAKLPPRPDDRNELADRVVVLHPR